MYARDDGVNERVKERGREGGEIFIYKTTRLITKVSARSFTLGTANAF